MNLYDVLAGQGTTHFERLFSQQFGGGGAVQTLTGIPPLSFMSNGEPLISWSMLGNGQQTGTPTPDNPIQPEFVGVASANVMPAGEKKTVIDNGVTFVSDGNGRYHISGTPSSNSYARFNLVTGFTTPISVSNGGRGTLSFFNSQPNGLVALIFYNGTVQVDDWFMTPANRTHTTYNAIGNKYIDSIGIIVNAGKTVDMMIMPEFTNDGVLPNKFEPYGYKIPITCAGQTTPVCLGKVPTVRRVKKLVFTGTEALQTSGSGNARFFYMTIADARSWETIISDRYVNANIQSTTEEIGVAMSGNSQFRIRPDTTSTVEEYKQYLASEYSAGHPVTVWYALANEQTGIVNEPLAKIDTYADELHSEDKTVSILTIKGQNTLTVEGDLPPSSMTITYKS